VTTPIRQLMNRMHQAMKRDGLTAQVVFFADRSINHGFPTSRDGLRAVLEDIERTFPDFDFEVLDLVVENDTAIGRYAITGTHRGTQRLPFVHGGVLAGLAPTNRSFRIEHVHVFRFSDGKIVQHDAVQDNLEMARQLGCLVIPTPESPTLSGR
jgi:predicted ester cyclase